MLNSINSRPAARSRSCLANCGEKLAIFVHASSQSAVYPKEWSISIDSRTCSKLKLGQQKTSFCRTEASCHAFSMWGAIMFHKDRQQPLTDLREAMRSGWVAVTACPCPCSCNKINKIRICWWNFTLCYIECGPERWIARSFLTFSLSIPTITLAPRLRLSNSITWQGVVWRWHQNCSTSVEHQLKIMELKWTESGICWNLLES